jgi:hypothetical protein
VELSELKQGEMMTDGNKTSQVIPFGKYAGQPVEVLRGDPDYVRWLMGQDWFRSRFTAIHTLIVNNFGEPAETPEHNALQAQFLDDGFCREVLKALGRDPARFGCAEFELNGWDCRAAAKSDPGQRSRAGVAGPGGDRAKTGTG